MPNQHSSSSSSTHDHSPSKPFTLGSLISDALGFWLIAWLLGILTALSVICLLMVSGWFVTLSAWAGLTAMGFNYLAPSALIRTFAITRTAGRYGELMTAHQAVFGVLKSLRLRFFAQFARLTPSLRKRLDSSDSQYRMVKDIDILDEFVLKFMSPLIISLAALLVVLGMISVMISAWFWLAFVVAFAIFALAVCQGIPLAKDERDLLWRRKQHFAHGLPAITQLILWGRWHGWLDSFSAHDRAVNRFFIDSHRLTPTSST